MSYEEQEYTDKSPSPDCPYEIRPLPHLFCERCGLNGCYPWNDNPLLLCPKMGGLIPVVIVEYKNEAVECKMYKEVTITDWTAHFSDLKREAEHNEVCRKKAMKSKMWSSELLPAERVGRKRK